jgi:hypothetical protein
MTLRVYRGSPVSRLSEISIVIMALGLTACEGQGPEAEVKSAASNPCGPAAAALQAQLPGSVGTDEISTDCAAWQGFVALNWRADPNRPGYPDPTATAAQFGDPADTAPKVWETYLEAAAVFDGPLQGRWQSKRPASKQLVRTSKFHTLDLSDITQAGSGHHWLTSQRGEITYYEVMMNRDEYEFITQEGFDLTTAAGQASCASQPGKPVGDSPPPHTGPLRGGFNMPQGIQPGWQDTDCAGNVKGFGDGVGAMEIKASWTPLPADGSLNYRYKTAQAQIQDPVTKQMRSVTVGLVGLHIVRKRFPRAQWVWATFEHVDNTPDAGSPAYPPKLPSNPNIRPGPGYTFFNPACNPAKDPYYQCKVNAPPTRCQPGVTACQPYNAPMQIARLRPVPDAANRATAWFWSLLPAKSVFNYYRLVDVQWPTKPQIVVAPGQRVPAGMGTPTPQGNAGGTQQIVANTTLESFQQDKNACMDCHVFASIAQPSTLQANAAGLKRLPKPGAAGQAPYASDFSFLFATETKR